MRDDRCIIFPTLAGKKKKRNVLRIKQCSKYALLCFRTVLESGLLCLAVWIVSCTTLRDNISIL